MFSYGTFSFYSQTQYHSKFLPLPRLCFCCLPVTTSDYIKRLRYCEYLGRYFCQCCHENAQAVVPARVLRKWDFSKYYVSNFARDLLSKIAGDPLFNPSDINTGLYKKIKALEAVRVRQERDGKLDINCCIGIGCFFLLVTSGNPTIKSR